MSVEAGDSDPQITRPGVVTVGRDAIGLIRMAAAGNVPAELVEVVRALMISSNTPSELADSRQVSPDNKYSGIV